MAPAIRELLDIYLEDYFAAHDDLTWAGLRRRQQGCHASLAFGGAGIAYAFWYAGHLRGDPELLRRAELWIRQSFAGRRNRLAFLYHGTQPGVAMPPCAYLYGRTGLHFTAALIARSLADHRAEARALTHFARLSRTAAEGSAELYTGGAGCLAGTAILFHHLGGSLLHDLGSDLARDLARRALLVDSSPVAWQGLRGLGLAHGTAGVLLALLLWHAASAAPLPSWFVPTLAEILDLAHQAPHRLTRPASHYSFLCTGTAGLVYLATRAASILRQPAFLAAAQAAARLALAHLPGRPDLCCGRAGCAYILLPLAQLDPPGPWRATARDLALSILLCDRSDWVFTGLYGGEAAIPCLALNLIHHIDGGPPCLDFIPAPSQPDPPQPVPDGTRQGNP
jgi:serine/threonine-protein kinase